MLSELQVRKMALLFRVHDTDANGSVERDDYERMVRRIAENRGWAEQSAEFDALRARVLRQWAAISAAADPPGSGRVHLDGWIGLWEAILEVAYESHVRGVSELLWEMMDTDGDGRVTRDQSLLWFSGYGVSTDTAEYSFTSADLNSDGYVSREEWLVLVDQFFLSKNPADPGNLIFGPLEGVDS